MTMLDNRTYLTYLYSRYYIFYTYLRPYLTLTYLLTIVHTLTDRITSPVYIYSPPPPPPLILKVGSFSPSYLASSEDEEQEEETRHKTTPRTIPFIHSSILISVHQDKDKDKTTSVPKADRQTLQTALDRRPEAKLQASSLRKEKRKKKRI